MGCRRSARTSPRYRKYTEHARPGRLLDHSRVIVPPVNNAALHHEDGMPQRLGVRDRVARDRDQIGIAARLDGADLVGPTQQLASIGFMPFSIKNENSTV